MATTIPRENTNGREHLEEQGYVLASPDSCGRVTYAKPATACLHPVRGLPGWRCLLNPGHSGYHSCVVFECDGCDKRHRGTPEASNEDVAFCFMCVRGSASWERHVKRAAQLRREARVAVLSYTTVVE